MTEKEKTESDKKTDKTEDPNAMIAQFQMLQQQLQGMLMQKETLNINKIEIERAIEELTNTPEKTAYKITGNVMISKPVEELKKDLENTKEAIDIRMSGVEKTEKRLTEQLRTIQLKLQKLIK